MDMFSGFEIDNAKVAESARRAAWDLHIPFHQQEHAIAHKYRLHAGALVDLASSCLRRFGQAEGYERVADYGGVGTSEGCAVNLKVAFVVCLKFEVYQDREDRVAFWLYENEREARRSGKPTPLPLMERMS